MQQRSRNNIRQAYQTSNNGGKETDKIKKLRKGLGRVDKRDSQGARIVIQAGICDGDQLGTRLDVGRGMGVS